MLERPQDPDFFFAKLTGGTPLPSIAFHLSYLYQKHLTKNFTGRQIGRFLFARIWMKRYDMIKLELQKSDIFPLIPRYILEPSLKWIGDSALTL